MSKIKQPTPSLDAYKIKIESLKLPSDGRTWKSNLHPKEFNVRFKESKPVDCKRGEEEGEREDALALSPDGQTDVSADRTFRVAVEPEVTADELIAEIKLVDMNATVTGKDRTGISRALAESGSGREVLPLVRDRVSGMDAFELKHAGSTIAAELPGLGAASRKAREDEQDRAEHLRRIEACLAADSKRVREA